MPSPDPVPPLSPDLPLPEPGLCAVAETAAHSLNNAMGALYAAIGHLDLLAPSPACASAQAAIEQACSGIAAVSEALLLLSLSEADLRLLQAPSGMDEAQWTRIARTLRDVAGVDLRLNGHLTTPSWAAREILAALMICVATTVRRMDPRRQPMTAILETAAGATAQPDRLVFRLQLPDLPDPARLIASAAQHPAGHALAHARRLLGPSAVSVLARADGWIELHLGKIES